MFFYGHVKTGSRLRSAAVLYLKWPRNSFVRFFHNRGDQYFYPAQHPRLIVSNISRPDVDGLLTSRLADPGRCS
jgi:hypothetical protein